MVLHWLIYMKSKMKLTTRPKNQITLQLLQIRRNISWEGKAIAANNNIQKNIATKIQEQKEKIY